MAKIFDGIRVQFCIDECGLTNLKIPKIKMPFPPREGETVYTSVFMVGVETTEMQDELLDATDFVVEEVRWMQDTMGIYVTIILIDVADL